jgi:hypothetical protein
MQHLGLDRGYYNPGRFVALVTAINALGACPRILWQASF